MEMNDQAIKILLVLNLLLFLSLVLRPLFVLPSVAAQSTEKPDVKDNQELSRLMDEDQADRMPASGKSIDWKTVGLRDGQRLNRVKEIYERNQLHTGNDYFNAALILQHGNTPEDYLLAHELW